MHARMSAFSFQAFLNILSVSVPIVVNHTFPLAYYVAETASFVAMIFLLHYLPLKNKKQ